MSELTGLVAIVTGSSSGIGAGIAEHLASLHVKVTLTARRQNLLEEVKAKCVAAGAKPDHVLVVVGDVTKMNDLDKIIKETVSNFGQINFLVNNTGFAFQKGLRDIREDEFDITMSTNVKSAQFLSTKALPYLIKTKGSIVNISSVAANIPMLNMSTYCMSKAAMNMLTKCQAADYAKDGIRVNAICPGIIDTAANEDMPVEMKASMNPLHRVGSPAEIACMVSHLLRPSTGGYMTGACVDMDGGSAVMYALTSQTLGD